MTEIKSHDIIKLTYANGEMSYSLVDEIGVDKLRVREPPDKTHVLKIENGYIEGIDMIEIVYSAPITGVAVAKNFVPGQSIVFVYKNAPEEEHVGLVTHLEEDMIDVNVDGNMIYIDFGYVGIPEEFQSITLHGGFIFDMEDDYYIPESQHRFTLERQLSDFMDKLLSLPNQTSRTIRNANTTVQRFRELRQLFSNENIDPIKHADNYVPTIEPHQVKWILPVVEQLEKGRLRRTLYPKPVDSLLDLKDLENIQQGKDGTIGPSFKSIYKKILNSFQPFVSDNNGTLIQDNVTVLLKNPQVLVSEKIVRLAKVKHIPQVLIKPYADPYRQVVTTPELANFSSFYLLPVDYTRAFVPGNTLLTRSHFQQLAPYIHPAPHGEPVTTLSNCIPSPQSLIDQAKPYYSTHACIQQLSPYLIHKNDVSIDLYDILQQTLQSHVNNYVHKLQLPNYKSNPLVEYDHQSASERQVELLHTDNGSLYAITQCKKMGLDYTSNLDKHIEKKMDSSQVAPPVVKMYESLKTLKSDNNQDIFYDPSLDKTDYDAYKGLDTKELIDHLVRVEYMSPRDAYLYAPSFLNKRRPVINGEYAQLTTNNGPVYYKRINEAWKLDETCAGPYPCTTNEPECTATEETCADITFRLKQNLIHSIRVDYELDMYKNKATYDVFLKEQEQVLTKRLHAKQLIRNKSMVKYNNKFNAMGKSTVVVHQSPKTPLLFLILEKPYEERYNELSHFIRSFTRGPHETEDEHWFYCTSTGLKLIPKVFQQLVKGYEEQNYKETLDRLQTEGLLKSEEDTIVTVHGGFPVEAIDLVHTFEDTVRSTELIEDTIRKIKREDDPMTPFLVELLNAVSLNVGANVTAYYNFMIHKILTVQTNPLLQSIGLVLKFAEIEYNISLPDKIESVLKKLKTFHSILTKYKLPLEDITSKEIQQEIKAVSRYYEVKQLIQQKTKYKAGVQKTSSTVWNTFLPPTHLDRDYGTKTAYNSVMSILYMIQRSADKPLMREGNYRINTISSQLVPEEAKRLMREWTPYFMTYTKSKLFIPNVLTWEHDTKFTETIFPKKVVTEVQTIPDNRSFDRLIPPLLELLKHLGFPVFFVTRKEMPLVYLQTFIQNIGRLFPSFLVNKPTQYKLNAIPVTFEDILSESHDVKLIHMMEKSIFAALKPFSTEGLGLDQLLMDPEIDLMIGQFQLPKMESDRHKYEFYIYTIFQKYVTLCPREHMRVMLGILKTYQDFYTQDADKVFIDMDAIDAHMLTAKALESNKRRIELNKLDAQDKHVFNFRQTANIDKKAQLGRKRDYNIEQFEMEADLFGTGSEDNDQGGDGNDEETD